MKEIKNVEVEATEVDVEEIEVKDNAFTKFGNYVKTNWKMITTAVVGFGGSFILGYYLGKDEFFDEDLDDYSLLDCDEQTQRGTPEEE